MADIMHRLHIGAPPEKAYQAITTAEGVRSWWTRDADLEPKVGGAGRFRFHAGHSLTEIRVDQLDPPLAIQWSVMASFVPQWVGTTIRFDLSLDADGTVLAFAHRGFPTADEAYAMTTTGWAYYLVSLQQYLETGAGAPSPDVDFARMIRHKGTTPCPASSSTASREVPMEEPC